MFGRLFQGGMTECLGIPTQSSGVVPHVVLPDPSNKPMNVRIRPPRFRLLEQAFRNNQRRVTHLDALVSIISKRPDCFFTFLHFFRAYFSLIAFLHLFVAYHFF